MLAPYQRKLKITQSYATKPHNAGGLYWLNSTILFSGLNMSGRLYKSSDSKFPKGAPAGESFCCKDPGANGPLSAELAAKN